MIHKRQWWNDDLRILLDQIASQLHEIDVETLNFPAKWVGLQDNHEGLGTDHLANFRGDELIDTKK